MKAVGSLQGVGEADSGLLSRGLLSAAASGLPCSSWKEHVNRPLAFIRPQVCHANVEPVTPLTGHQASRTPALRTPALASLCSSASPPEREAGWLLLSVL